MKKIEKMIKNNIDLKTNYNILYVAEKKNNNCFFKYVFIVGVIIIFSVPTLLSNGILRDTIVINELDIIYNINYNPISDNTMYMKDTDEPLEMNFDLENIIKSVSTDRICSYNNKLYCVFEYRLNNSITEIKVSRNKKIYDDININELKKSNIKNTNIYIIKLPDNYVSIFSIDKINFIVKTNENDYNNHIDVVKKIIGG